MRRSRRLALALLIAAALPAAAARGDDAAAKARTGVQEGQLVPLESILAWIEARYAGRFVEAELEEEHGTPIYEIEWRMPQGRLIELEFDARTGALLERERHASPKGRPR
jgi:uncharacterized membrane protein YkoI